MIDQALMWIIFGVIVVIMFALDLGLFNRGSHHISVKKSLYLTAFWIAIALAFGLFIYIEMGAQSSMEYYTSYVVEKAMSVDNLFVFLIIFSMFMIPDEYQHKALFWGIIGAIVFRALFIFVGAELLNTFDVVMYIFGAILIYTAYKTITKKENVDPEKSFAFKLSKCIKCSPELDGNKFFTVKNGVKLATPLFLAVIVIELTDIMFAFDSIPACLAITTDEFIVYTSNIFAILGLRSLYFALRGSLSSLKYLKYGLGAILAFVGIKMLIAEFYHVDVIFSLVVILGLLAITVIISLMKKDKVAEIV